MKTPNIILGLTLSVILSGCELIESVHVIDSDQHDYNVSIIDAVSKDKKIIAIRKHHKETFGEDGVSPFLDVSIDGSYFHGDLSKDVKMTDGKYMRATPNITEEEMQTFWRVYFREVSKTDFKGKVILDIYPNGKKRQFSATIHGTRPVTIFDAIEERDMSKIREMLKNNPELISSKEKHGFAPLHGAACVGDKAMMELFLAYHADVNAEDNEGYTPLHAAAKLGHMNLVSLLLANGAKVNARDKKGYTPLHAAALTGNKDMAQLLLNNKADPMVRATTGDTPLHVAAAHGHKDFVVLLLANKADVNSKDKDGYTPLHFAAMHAQLSVVEVLLANHARVDARTEGDPHGFERGSTPLLLLSDSTVPDDRQIKVMKLLIASGANVNTPNICGEAPLYSAAWRGHKKAVEVLLASKANVNAKDSNGDTPLAIASRKNHKDVVDLLRQHGAHE